MPALLWLPIRESNLFHLIHSTSVSSWSFRPSRYVLSHSHLPHTSMTINGISSVIPAHLIPLHSPLSLTFPPSPSLGFPFSFDGFEVFDWTPGYLSENSLISMSSTRALHSWLTIFVLPALTTTGCLAISASQCLPPSYISQVPCSDSTSEPWTPLPSLLWLPLWESNLFHQVHSP